jgi:hypothetical protein
MNYVVLSMYQLRWWFVNSVSPDVAPMLRCQMGSINDLPIFSREEIDKTLMYADIYMCNDISCVRLER